MNLVHLSTNFVIRQDIYMRFGFKLFFSCFLSINASNIKWRFVCCASRIVKYTLICSLLNFKIFLLYSCPEVLSSKTFFRHFRDLTLAHTTDTPNSRFMVSFVYFYILWSEMGACRSTVGWGTVLQVGRPRVRFPMVSWEFFIAIILPDVLWPWGRLRL